MSGNDADMAKMSAQQKKDCDNNDDMFAYGVFAMFMEGKDNKEAAKYYKKAYKLGKKKSDPVF